MEKENKLNLWEALAEEKKKAAMQQYILKLTSDEYAKIAKDVKQYKEDFDIEFQKLERNPIKIMNLLLRNLDVYSKRKKEAEECGHLRDEKCYQALVDEILQPEINRWWKNLVTGYDMSLKVPSTQQNIVAIQSINSGNALSQQIKTSFLYSQITCRASLKEIMDYFMILYLEKNPSNGKPYMSKEDVIDFVHSNFAVSGKPFKKKYYPINIEAKSTLTFFIYQFYYRFDYVKNKHKYACLLINNFEEYANENSKILSSNMSESKRSKNGNNVIDTEKYFQKQKSGPLNDR